MSAKTRDAEHFVYVHYNHVGDVIYVGMTADPKRRPTAPRPWLHESAHLEISPPMPRESAKWAEHALISAHLPKHNINKGATAMDGSVFIADWQTRRTA